MAHLELTLVFLAVVAVAVVVAVFLNRAYERARDRWSATGGAVAGVQVGLLAVGMLVAGFTAGLALLGTLFAVTGFPFPLGF